MGDWRGYPGAHWLTDPTSAPDRWDGRVLPRGIGTWARSEEIAAVLRDLIDTDRLGPLIDRARDITRAAHRAWPDDRRDTWS